MSAYTIGLVGILISLALLIGFALRGFTLLLAAPIAAIVAAAFSGEPLAVVLACAVLTFGGVSLFVVAFAVFPVAAPCSSRPRFRTD
jgi:H+/gluconate symporter-like permease